MKKAVLVCVLFFVTVLLVEAQVTYNMVGPIQYPESLQNTPGQLGKKGKLLFLPLDENGGKSIIYVSKRKKAGKAFNVFVKVEGLTDDAYHPTVDAKAKTIVFVSGSEQGGWSSNDLYIATRKGKKGAFSNLRKLDEVNTPDVADAYPFLTGDALELYFFKQNQCYYASREKTDEKFSAALPFVPVNNLLDSINSSGTLAPSLWLSNNGKTIMVLCGQEVYKAERRKTKEPFGAFELYVAKETFDGLGFVSGITFTDDLEEFYVYSDPEVGEKQMLWFRKSKY